MKTINLNQRDVIEPIEWTQYNGEEVIVKTIIKGGKKIQEKQFYEDKVKAVPEGNAYIIGNGPSRKDFDLSRLKESGQTYGCNALYRDFMPDFIFSVDSKMTMQMIDDQVGMNTIHYAPALEVNRDKKQMLHLIPNNPHWISGNAAFWTAGVHGHQNIYLVGFDFREYGKGELNNMYQGTNCYGERDDDKIFDKDNGEKTKINSYYKKIANDLYDYYKLISLENNISYQILSPKKMIFSYLKNKDSNSRLINGWRKELIDIKKISSITQPYFNPE